MYSLRSVGVMSCAKMMGAIYGCLGLIVLPFFLLGGFASLFGQGSTALSGVVMFFFAILAPFFYGAMGFAMGALTAWVYNVVARRIGGILLEVKSEAASSQSNPGLI